MSFKKILTTAVVSASVVAGSLIPLASAANAGNWQNRHGIERGYNGHNDGWNNRRHSRAYENYGHRRHRDHTGRNLAIGAFATILGLAIAAEANRGSRNYYYDDRD